MLQSNVFTWLLAGLIFGCNLHGQVVSADNVCTITMPTDMPKSEPVILYAAASSSEFELFKPTGEHNSMAEGSKLLLLCPGGNNAIEALNQESVELLCRSDGSFATAAGQEYAFNQLGCKSIPTSTLLLTSQPCAQNRGYIFEAGFEYNNDQFATVFSICYDNVTEHTFYTHNILNGAAIDFKVIEGTRRAFRANGMQFTTTATNTFYTINNQIARFGDYFGVPQTHINTTMYMARGHLSPDADFVFSYEQLATYFYVNVAPEWQVINAGNWVRVENLARNLAVAYGGDLEIYTGTMGQLTLGTHDIYLDDGHFIEAPKYYFKVIKHAPTDAAIVIISLNNPFADSDEADEFCENVCQRADVHTPFFDDMRRGYTFCCELNDFKNHYDGLPSDLTATNLLNEHDEEESEEVEDEPPFEGENPNAEGCSITMTTDIPQNEPVYFVSASGSSMQKLFKPTGDITTIPIGSSLTLVCAGSGNNLELLDQETVELKCQSDGSFYSSEKQKTFQLQELNCLRVPTSDIRTTDVKCGGDQGYIFEAGYESGPNFGSVFEVCYDNATETVLYTRNIINGATMDFRVIDSTKRAFRANGMQFSTVATNALYTINNQIGQFEKHFGPEQVLVNNSMYLARSHLSSDADFIFSYEQLATYFYVNVAPKWQIINAGNWLHVENLARQLAMGYSSDLLTFNGVLGILQLRLPSRDCQAIYLDDGQFFEAPKWFYKVLIHPELESNMVMITLNNPFAKPEDIVEFCTNVCAANGFDSPLFDDIRLGYTFCCTLEDFQNSVQGLPIYDLPAEWQG